MAAKGPSIDSPIRPYLPTVDKELWQYLLLEIYPLIKIGKTSAQVLDVFETSDNASELGKALKGNQYYGDALQKLIKEKGLKSEARDEANAAVLLGMLNTRNIICASQMWRNIHGEDLQSYDFEKILYFANKANEFKQLFGKSGPMWVYASGLIWDFIRELMTLDERFDQKELTWLNKQFERAYKAGKMAFLLLNERKEDQFLFYRHTTAACLVLGAGYALMAFLDPENYPNVLDKALEEKLGSPGIQLMEQAWFGISHCQMATLLSASFPMFQDINPSLICADHPQILNQNKNKKSKDYYFLSLAIHLSFNAISYQQPALINPAKIPLPWDAAQIDRAFKRALT